MIKNILQIIGVMMGFILLIGGIVLGSTGMIAIIKELVIINENIAYGVLGLIYGLFISMLGYRIVQWIIKD